jgi:hypothetical protein
MTRIAALIVALVVGVPALNTGVHACGDKFLMVGRGAKFQRAYASVYPGKVVVYARPSTDPKAAVRDPQLHKALRQAGHTVSVIEDWTLLEQALINGLADVVLVDVAESARLQPAVASSPTHPQPMYVAFPSSPAPAVRADVVCRLKSSDRPLKYLEEIENVLKARAKQAKNS